MLPIAIVLFGIAAIGGVILAYRAFRGPKPPRWLVAAHGILAVLALVAYLTASARGFVGPYATTALLLFLIAPLGGLVLLWHDLKGRKMPPALILIHGGIAVVAYILLLVAYFQVSPV